MHEPESSQRISLTERRFAAPLQRNFAIAAAALILPFTIINAINEALPVAMGTGLLFVALVAAAIKLHFTGKSILNGGGIIVFAVSAVYLATYFLGVIGIYWSYPVVLLFHFMFNQKKALIGNLFYIAAEMPLAILAVGWAQGARVFFTLLLTSAFAHLFSRRLMQQQNRLQRLALIDHLTGAFNRRYLDDCLEITVQMKLRYSTSASLLVIDVDHFKDINDRLGHKVGDDVLVNLVAAVHRRIRKTDQLFRMGGDEFVLLLPGTDLHWACRLAQDLRHLVTALSEQMEVPVSISSGAAELCQGESAESWLSRCDQALYAAKNAGRNTVSSSHSHVVVGGR